MIRKLIMLGLILTAAYFVAKLDKSENSAPVQTPSPTRQHSSTDAANDNLARGDFDFYLLALSWSPSHCASTGWQDNQQCGLGARHGFVVHGLWPQNETGWPEFCPTTTDRVPPAVVDAMMDIMPSQGLILHQWRKHGSCTSLSPSRYFELTRAAMAKIKIPTEYQRPHTALMTQPDYIESRFIASNPGLKPDMIHVTCGRQSLQEVRICMDKNLNFRSCPNLEYRSCRPSTIKIPPVGQSNG